MTADVSVPVPVPWRNDESRLTRDLAASTWFPLTAWTKRGYDPAAVEAFRAGVLRELEMLATEKTAAWQALADLRRRFISHDDPGDWPAGAGDAHEMAVNMRSAAQVAADQTMATAQELAARMHADARTAWDATVADAEQRAEAIRRDADDYAARVRAEADQQAREAAEAALEEPVPAEAGNALRASRARVAAMSARSDVSLRHIRFLLAAAMQIADEEREHEAHGPEPVPPPLPRRR